MQDSVLRVGVCAEKVLDFKNNFDIICLKTQPKCKKIGGAYYPLKS